MSKFKRTLVYLLTVLIALPVSLIIGSAQSASAAGLDTQDFGVMQFSGVNGYSVGFGLMGMKASDLKSAEVTLFRGDKLLSKNTSDDILEHYPNATSLSSPFNINGYYDYSADDENWLNSGWDGTVYDIPTRAHVSVVDNTDKIYSADFGAPTGDPSLLAPKDYVEPASLAVVQPADFGTMRFSNVSGYTVGFTTATYQASQIKKAEIKLYKGATLLSSVVSDQIMTQYPTAKTLSAPFDVNGTFDYAADGAWDYSGWNGTLLDIPTRAVIIITDKMDNTYTVENDNAPTGTPLPYIAAQDFSVMQISGVNGYNVGFGLNGITAADIASAKVELFKDSTLLSTSNAVITNPPVVPSINSLGATTSLSAPFDIDGTFDYEEDGYWTNTGWNGSLLDIPTKAVITLVDSLGARYSAENSSLTGDPSSLLPVDSSSNPTIVKAAQLGNGKTIDFDFKGSGIDATDYIVSVNGIPTASFKNVLGDDTGFLYHSEISVSGYQDYSVQVVAYHYGVKVGETNVSVRLTAPVTTVAAPVVTQSEVVSRLSVAPQSTKAAETVTDTTKTTGEPKLDEQGKIKGEDDAATDEEDSINWTPWIILFILILLAGAATGGYFYWFGGDDEKAQTVVRKAEVKTPAAATTETKKPAAKTAASKKKSRRW